MGAPIPVPRTWRVSASVGFADGSMGTVGPEEVYSVNITGALDGTDSLGDALDDLVGEREPSEVTSLSLTVVEIR